MHETLAQAPGQAEAQQTGWQPNLLCSRGPNAPQQVPDELPLLVGGAVPSGLHRLDDHLERPKSGAKRYPPREAGPLIVMVDLTDHGAQRSG
jgi:hypothetical protein